MDYLIGVVIFIVGLLLGKFLPSYMLEKGKNLATKEDIGEITAIVENSKIDYIKQIESFKLELSKEIHKYSEDVKIQSSNNYNKYIKLYSKLYQAVLQSEYLKEIMNIDGTFEEIPFVELHRSKTNESWNKEGYSKTVTKIDDDLTKLNKKYLIDVTFENCEYASEQLLKTAVKYRFVHEFYLIEDHPLHTKLIDEEIKLIKEFVELIIKETNELKQMLGFEFNQYEIESYRIQ